MDGGLALIRSLRHTPRIRHPVLPLLGCLVGVGCAFEQPCLPLDPCYGLFGQLRPLSGPVRCALSAVCSCRLSLFCFLALYLSPSPLLVSYQGEDSKVGVVTDPLVKLIRAQGLELPSYPGAEIQKLKASWNTVERLPVDSASGRSWPRTPTLRSALLSSDALLMEPLRGCLWSQ